MGASPLMSLGVKALAANYAALQTTGHNIANANVLGYSRQRVELATSSPGPGTGSGFFGNGVDVVAVGRSHNAFLTREAASTRSIAAMDSTRLTQLRQLENIFQGGEAGLGHATSQLMLALGDLSSRPSDLATRQVALARASELASRFAQASDLMDQAQAGVDAELESSVEAVNALTQGIAQVNQRITSALGAGHSPNDLLDERERLISRLSTHLQVSRIEAGDGTVALFAGGGQRLVLGFEAVPLQTLQDPRDPSRSAVGVSEFGRLRTLDENTLGGGGIAGLLRFQNDDLVTGRNLVGRLAAAVGEAINTQQMRGLNLQQPLGSVPSSALFALGPSLALNHDRNARDGSGNFIANLTLTRVDAAALQASDYELAEDPANPGNWLLTRLADAQTTTVVSGDTVDGMLIDFGAPGPQSGDRFLLQPVARAASGMHTLLSDPRDLAAASSLIGSTGVANLGSASVGQLTVTAAPLPTPGATALVTFTSDSGDYTWELFDNNNVLLSTGTDTWQAGAAIPRPPLDINGFSLQLAGVPRSGDTVTVAPTPANSVASNNGNALALVSLRDAGIAGGRSATDAWALALSDIGVRVQSSKTSADISDAVAAQSELSRSSLAGVNLDEEAATLIQYQQSYQAAAKVLQVAQQLFDSVLNVTR